MGSMVNDDRSDETWRREEAAFDRVRQEHPELSFDAAWDLAMEQIREHREVLALAKAERQSNTLFGDIRKSH